MEGKGHEMQLSALKDFKKNVPHLTEVGGKTYNVDLLEQSATELKPEYFDLQNRDALEDILESKYWKDENGNFLGPSDVIRVFNDCGHDWEQVLQRKPEWRLHIEKIRNVPLNLPALVYQGVLIDGIHRFTRALCEGHASLLVKVLPELPSNAVYVSEES